jgi:hypothetical protein
VYRSCSQLKVNRRFGGTHCFPLPIQRIHQARNKLEVYTFILSTLWTTDKGFSKGESLFSKMSYCKIVICYTLVSCLTYSSTQKMVQSCSFETSVDFQLIA